MVLLFYTKCTCGTTHRPLRVIVVSEVHLHLSGPELDLLVVQPGLDLDRVEEHVVLHNVSRLGQTLGQQQGRVVNSIIKDKQTNVRIRISSWNKRRKAVLY